MVAKRQIHTEHTHRINLRLNGPTYYLVQRLAKHAGTTAPGFLKQHVEGMQPAFVELLATLDRADTVATRQEGVDVLEQLRTMAVRARAEAERFERMVDVWQGKIREEEGTHAATT